MITINEYYGDEIAAHKDETIINIESLTDFVKFDLYKN